MKNLSWKFSTPSKEDPSSFIGWLVLDPTACGFGDDKAYAVISEIGMGNRLYGYWEDTEEEALEAYNYGRGLGYNFINLSEASTHVVPIRKVPSKYAWKVIKPEVGDTVKILSTEKQIDDFIRECLEDGTSIEDFSSWIKQDAGRLGIITQSTPERNTYTVRLAPSKGRASEDFRLGEGSFEVFKRGENKLSWKLPFPKEFTDLLGSKNYSYHIDNGSLIIDHEGFVNLNSLSTLPSNVQF